eukprot:Em0001g1240a
MQDSLRRGSLETFNIVSPVPDRIARPRRQLPSEYVDAELAPVRGLVHKIRRELNELNQRNKALFLFEEQNSFRKRAKRIVKSRILEVFLGLVVILNAIALALFLPEPNLDSQQSNAWIRWVVAATSLCFAAEAFLKVISYGLLFHHKAFLRQYYNVADVVIIIMGFLQFALGMRPGSTAGHLVGQMCACFTALWLFRLLLRFRSPQFILKVLAKSVTPLVHFMVFSLIVIFFFALIGLDVFRGDLHKGCYADFMAPDGSLKSYITSSYACVDSVGAPSGAYVCANGSTCRAWDEGPYYKHLVLTLEGWTATFYLYEAIRGFAYVWIYFLSVALFGFIFVLNLLLGVVASVFQGVSEREEEQGKVRRSKEKQRDDEDIQNYRQWMRKALESEDVTDGSGARRPSWLFDPTSKMETAASDVQNTLIELKGKNICNVEFIVQSNPFILAMLGTRLLNTLLLMTIHYTPDNITYMQRFDLSVSIINYIFSIVYIIECCLKVYGLSYRRYFKTYMNIMDFTCTVLNILDLVVYLPVVYSLNAPVARSVSISIMVNAVRCLGLLRVLKYTKYWKSVKKIGRILSDVFVLTLSVLVIILIVDFVYALIGVRLFGGLVHIDKFMIPNFDNCFNAFLISVQMQTTENWNNVVSLAVRPYVQRYVEGAEPLASGIVINSFFTSQVLFISFVLVGVVTAVAFDKLSEVRKVEEDSQLRSEQREEERKEREKQINAVKNTSKPYIHRRTLRRAIEFYANIPTEAYKMVEGQRTEWHRSVSSPIGDVGGAIGKSLLNRMKSFRLSSSSEDVRKKEEGEVDHTPPSEEQNMMSQDTLVHDGSGGDGGGGGGGGGVSVVSAVSLSRTLSEPVGADRTSHVEAMDKHLSRAGSNAQSGSVDLDVGKTQPAQLLRECSLEDIRTAVSSHENSPVFIEASTEEHSALARRTANRNQQNTKQRGNASMGFKEKATVAWKWLKEYVGSFYLNPVMEPSEIPNHSAFFILSVDNRLRQFCFKVVHHKSFEVVALFVVLLGCGSLMLELPLPLCVTADCVTGLCAIQPVLVYVDLAITVFFTIEIVLKATAYGVFLHRGSYLRGVFNIIDVMVTVCTLVPIVVYLAHRPAQIENCVPYGFSAALSPQVSALKVTRVFRTLRFMRITSLYLVVSGVLVSLKKVLFIVVFNLLILVIFAVVGAHIFKGRFHYCTDPSKTTEEDCRGEFFTYESGDLSCPTVNERKWENYPINFDHIGISLMTVFVLLTKEGWPDIMYQGVNAVPLENYEPRGPKFFATPEASIYFVVFMIFVSSFLLSLFSGFVIVVFQEVGFKSYRQAKLDRNQRNCIYYALTARPKHIYSPRYGAYRKVYERMVWIASHTVFQVVIIVAVLINCITLAAQYKNDKNIDRCRTIDWINFGFTIFFGLEMLFKLAVFTPAIFFRSSWNAFECLIVIGSIVELIVSRAISQECQMTHIASAFRVLRLLRLIPNIHPILWTLVQTLEIFPWVGVLLAGLYVVYALLGMQAFGTINVASPDDSSDIMKYNNFANFLQALLVMIRVSTGENWENVMVSCSAGAQCDERAPSTRACGSDFAYVFFSSFLFSSSMLIVSLFVAIIIDNFDYLVRDKSKLGPLSLGKFVKLWSKYDPLATGLVHHENILNIFTSCNPPVGWGKLCPLPTQYKKMFELNMPMNSAGMVKFNAALFALVRSSLSIDCKGSNEELKGRLLQLFPTLQHKLNEVLPRNTQGIGTSMETVGPLYAAKFVQHMWRNQFLKKRKQSRAVRFKAGLRVQPNAGPALLTRMPSDDCLSQQLNLRCLDDSDVAAGNAIVAAEQVTKRPSFLWVNSGLLSVAEEAELTEKTSQHSTDSHSDDQSYTSAPGTPTAIKSLTTLPVAESPHAETAL